jgi:hypothetical protein
MAGWTKPELDQLEAAEELRIAPVRPDGTPRKPVTIWAVTHDGHLYARSAVKGRNASWYRGVKATRRGRIRSGGVEKDVELVDADPAINAEVDAAYRSKYRRYAGRILDSCLTPEARSTTIQIVPR